MRVTDYLTSIDGLIKEIERLTALNAELVQALEVLLDLYQHDAEHFDSLPETAGEKAWRKARAAIAKAENREG